MKSIGLKFWTGMMALVILVLILLWFFQIVFLEKFYTNMQIKQIKKTGYSITKEIQNLNQKDIVDIKNTEYISNIIDEFSYNNNLNIEILDAKGNQIYESTSGSSENNPMMKNHMKNHITDDVFNEVLKNKEITIPLLHPRFNNKFMFIGLPITIAEQTKGAIFINMPLAPMEDTVLILKKQLIYITIILLIASLVISFLISRTFTKPILKIKKISEKMALGDFSDRIESRSKDEIGQLAETINYMGQELSKIEQLRKDLIANVSHELRTPLSLIQGYAEVIKDVSGSDKDKREKHLDIIIDESKRLSGIVEDILNLSQMQAGYMGLKKERFLINDLINRVLKRYEVLIEKTGVDILSNINDEIEILADESRIEQVFYNIINNAFNYTDKGGSITVSSFKQGEYVTVEVTDTGIGMPEEEIKHIWDRYYKKDKVNKTGVVGTGLGLAIVKNILEEHNAIYGVKSKKNVGTTFWFKFPIEF